MVAHYHEYELRKCYLLRIFAEYILAISASVI